VPSESGAPAERCLPAITMWTSYNTHSC
jgi:hypothetical protein